MPQEEKTHIELGVIRIQVALHTFTMQQLRLILTHSRIGSFNINKHTHLVTIIWCCYLIGPHWVKNSDIWVWMLISGLDLKTEEYIESIVPRAFLSCSSVPLANMLFKGFILSLLTYCLRIMFLNLYATDKKALRYFSQSGSETRNSWRRRHWQSCRQEDIISSYEIHTWRWTFCKKIS